MEPILCSQCTLNRRCTPLSTQCLLYATPFECPTRDSQVPKVHVHVDVTCLPTADPHSKKTNQNTHLGLQYVCIWVGDIVRTDTGLRWDHNLGMGAKTSKICRYWGQATQVDLQNVLVLHRSTRPCEWGMAINKPPKDWYTTDKVT